MTQLSNRKMSDREFVVGDWVYLKLQPYRQTLVANRTFNKLSAKFYGLYRIIECIGVMAYKLELSTSSTIHLVFHMFIIEEGQG